MRSNMLYFSTTSNRLYFSTTSFSSLYWVALAHFDHYNTQSSVQFCSFFFFSFLSSVIIQSSAYFGLYFIGYYFLSSIIIFKVLLNI